MSDFVYSGDELDVFSNAKNWKQYWSKQLTPYMGHDILEVGAGIGTNTELLYDNNYGTWLALEPDEQLCESMKKKFNKLYGEDHGIDVKRGISADLSEKDLFDTAIYIDVLEHIEHDEAELNQVLKNIRPGGNVIILSPAHQWLYTDFDKKIGHYRRYSAKTLKACIPEGYTIKMMKYLDSVGMAASLSNKILINSDTPKKSQILLWDRFFVPASKWIDKILRYSFGKTIICVLEKNP